MGDATNLVLIFAGELLKKAENLIIMGLHPTDVIQGYELAAIKALEELERKQSSNLEKLLHPLMNALRTFRQNSEAPAYC
jgi:chaperonin GroEL (HSP60 family)